jgi:hypothetical protein
VLWPPCARRVHISQSPGLLEDVLQALAEALAQPREQVPVAVERQLDRRVAQPLLDLLRVRALRETGSERLSERAECL